MNEDLSKKYVSQDEQKKILVDLLLEFDSFCREHSLRYYLYAGTLLGAVRHSGFIPWDDDVDVCMPREDYDKFLKIYIGKTGKYKLVSLLHDKDYYYPFAKLVNDETVLIECKNDPGNLGVYLDIFPLDYCPGKTLEEAGKTVDKMNLLRWLRNFKIIEFSRKRKLYKNIILFIGKIITLPLSRRKISQMVSDKASNNINTDSKYIGEIVNTAYGHGEVFDKSLFGEGVYLDFENHKFVVPQNYDSVLKSMYGDYMQLPPVEKRITHHDFVCWYK